MRFLIALLSFIIVGGSTQAQWTIQQSHTTASLRGIHALGNGVAWASGSQGTVLHTTDDGTTWQTCTTPPDAEQLDFRAIQAFDAQTAIVMSSGKGDLSRLYKTTDACKSWTLLFTNPDAEGLWVALVFTKPSDGFLLGNPVKADDGQMRFAYFQTGDGGTIWHALHHGPKAYQATQAIPGATVSGASNSSLLIFGTKPTVITGGTRAYMVEELGAVICDCIPQPPPDSIYHRLVSLPLAEGPAAGASSDSGYNDRTIVVGGDPARPNESWGTAAYPKSSEPFAAFVRAETPPHGFRSSVAHAALHTWITVGPNGTDISIDDGKNWHPLKSSPSDQPDADRDWNALSLPFVVGPHGRIGKLRPDALNH